MQLEVKDSKDTLKNRELGELCLSDLANGDSFLKRDESTGQTVRARGQSSEGAIDGISNF